MTNTVRALLGNQIFMCFFYARILGITANQMLMVAVAWHMYELTGSAWDLGLVGLFQFIPALIMMLPAGHVADRMHRGRLFALCLAVQAVVCFVLFLSIQQYFDSSQLLFAISVVLGVARAFQMPAQQAITPLLVSKELMQRAVALSSSGNQVSVILGPALGGLLYVYGADIVYGACAWMMVAACIFTVMVRYQHRASQEAVSWSSAMAGVVFVWNNKILLGATSLDLFAVLLGGVTALLPIYAKDILNIGSEGLGFLRAAPAMGALIMSMALMRWPLQRKVGYWLLVSVMIFGAATIVFGLSVYFLVSMLALIATGAADNISVVTRLTIVQLQTPDEIRGRVSAVNSIFIGASNQLGEFESGSVAALWGPIVSVVSGGIGTILIAMAWFKLFPDLAQKDRMNDA
ncbi:MAG: MFS transporter [Limnohabitans sp.]|nr:MFS transporter [Limnohabitans sp.]